MTSSILNRRRPFRSREQTKSIHVGALLDAINRTEVDLPATQRVRLANDLYDQGIRVRLEDRPS